MSPEAQRIAIAQAYGWKLVRKDTDDPTWKGMWTHPDGTPVGFTPDYLCDLNAMAAAERTLTIDQRIVYTSALFEMCDCWPEAVLATATQRAEAFLRTLGLWVEDAP